MTINITQKELDNYAKYEDIVQDYPLYGHTDGLSRSQIVLIGKLLDLALENDTKLKVNIVKA